MPPAVPSKPINLSSQQTSSQYRDAVSRGVQSKVRQLIQAGILRRARPIKQCSGNWKPRMDLIDDPSSPNTIVIFELPGVKNENIVLQIKDRRLVVIGIRVDPFAEAIVAAKSSMEVPASPVSNGTDFAPHISADSLGNVADDPVTPSSTRPSMNKSIRELRYGSFFRSIPVPDGIKQSEISADVQDGMLTVTWPRVPAARSSISEVTPTLGATDEVLNALDTASVTHSSIPTEAAPISH